MKNIIKIAVVAFALLVVGVGFSRASFTDSVTVTSNGVTTGDWGESASIEAGDVVINEVMWMGSTASGVDEWIELRNMTDDEIDISGWKIEKALSGGGTLIIDPNSTIPAQGYFVIARYPSSGSSSDLNIVPDMYPVTNLSLGNSDNGHLLLKDAGTTDIDEAKGNSWPAGEKDTVKQSMQRKSTPGDGLLTENWSTCTDNGCQSGTFWKTAGGNNYGTPGAVNIFD